MTLRSLQTTCLATIILLIFPGLIFVQELKQIKLLEPQTDIGRPLMQVLKDRKSTRSFSSKELSMQTLSNLLWAAFGFREPPSDSRTAPSAMNQQEIDIYVSTAEGLYLYDAGKHALNQILAKDIRNLTGIQSFVGRVPVNLIYVADFSKMHYSGSDEKKIFTSAADTGFISQNVYLYCASEYLATVVRGMIKRKALSKAMQLRPDQKIILSQSVGYP